MGMMSSRMAAIPDRLHLAFLPTPIQKVTFNGFEFLMKRDDLTGMETSGNKIRKLEYILAGALKVGAKTVFTTGGEQSNHARATVAACRALGLNIKLFLWGESKNHVTGNLFIDKFLGADIRFLNYEEFLNAQSIMESEAEELRKHENEVYIVPEGGSSAEGIQGYINFWDEIGGQFNISEFDEIYIAAGSGGTAAGLLIGAAIKNIKTKIYAVSVLYQGFVLEKKIDAIVDEYRIQYAPNLVLNRELLEIVDGYSSEGYKKISGEKVALLKEFALQTGIIFDPVYTGKAFYAFNDRVILGKSNKKALFLHTGGLFGVFEKTEEYLAL